MRLCLTLISSESFPRREGGPKLVTPFNTALYRSSNLILNPSVLTNDTAGLCGQPRSVRAYGVSRFFHARWRWKWGNHVVVVAVVVAVMVVLVVVVPVLVVLVLGVIGGFGGDGCGIGGDGGVMMV